MGTVRRHPLIVYVLVAVLGALVLLAQTPARIGPGQTLKTAPVLGDTCASTQLVYEVGGGEPTQGDQWCCPTGTWQKCNAPFGGAAGLEYDAPSKRLKFERFPWCDVTHTAYGADPTGVADSSLAMNAASTACGLTGTVMIPEGSYKLIAPVTIIGNLDLTGEVTLTYDTCNIGPALRIGSTSTVYTNRRVKTPILVRTAADWYGSCSVSTTTKCVDDADCPGETCVITDCGTVGLDIVNVARSTVEVAGSINRFSVGLLTRGLTQTSADNTLSFTGLFNNKVGWLARGEGSNGAWNDNTVLAGKIAITEVDPSTLAGTFHVLFTRTSPAGAPNTNTIVGLNVEGTPPDDIIRLIHARANKFLNPRFEGSGTGRRVRFVGSVADGNLIEGGNDLDEIDFLENKSCSTTTEQWCDVNGDCPGGETCSGGQATRNSIIGARLKGTAISAASSGNTALALMNASSAASGALTIFSTASGPLLQQLAGTTWTMQCTAQTCEYKARTDAGPRVTLDFDGTGAQILLDDGNTSELYTAYFDAQDGDLTANLFDTVGKYNFQFAGTTLDQITNATTVWKQPTFIVNDGTTRDWSLIVDLPGSGSSNANILWDSDATPLPTWDVDKPVLIRDNLTMDQPGADNVIVMKRAGTTWAQIRGEGVERVQFSDDSAVPFLDANQGDLTLRQRGSNVDNEIISQTDGGGEDSRLVLGEDIVQMKAGLTGDTIFEANVTGLRAPQITSDGCLRIAAGTISSSGLTCGVLGSNGANCAAGQSAAGVDAAGAVEGCFTPAGTPSGTSGMVQFTTGSAFSSATGFDFGNVSSGSLRVPLGYYIGAGTATTNNGFVNDIDANDPFTNKYDSASDSLETYAGSMGTLTGGAFGTVGTNTGKKQWYTWSDVSGTAQLVIESLVGFNFKMESPEIDNFSAHGGGFDCTLSDINFAATGCASCYGAGNQACVDFDGADMVVNPRVSGSGDLLVKGDVRVESTFMIDGGLRKSIQFNQPNNMTGDTFMLAGSTATASDKGQPSTRAGSVVAIWSRCDYTVDLVDGNVEMQVYVGSSVVLESSVAITTAGEYKWGTTQARGTDTFVQGAEIAVELDFTGALTGTFDDCMVEVEVVLDD